MRLPRVKDYPAFLEAWGDRAKAPRRSDAPTVVSAFAGAGGSSLGYRMAGYDVRLGYDNWDLACATYRRNGGHAAQLDITEVAARDILREAGLAPGELDVYDGSPPCQGYSLAGKRAIDDPRNRLFVDFAAHLKALKPKAFVMENVSGLLRGKMRPTFREITAHLKAQGYEVRCKLLDASWLGVPQERHRLIWIGTRKKHGLKDLHPAPTWRPVSMAEGLRGLLDVAHDALLYGGGNRDADNVEPYLRRPARGADEPASSLIARRPPKITTTLGGGRKPARTANPLQGSLQHGWRGLDEPAHTIVGEAPPVVATKEPPRIKGHFGGSVARSGDRPAPTVAANEPPRIEHTVKQAGHRVRAGEEPSKTVATNARPYVRMRGVAHGFKPTTLHEGTAPSPTVTGMPWDRELSDGAGAWRRLTARECARLQSFPDWYAFDGSETQQVKQIGNAVPPLMAAQIGVAVARRALEWDGAPEPLEVARKWTA